MVGSSVAQPVLSAEEWTLVVELLEREQAHLPVEIRHTRTHAFKEQLRHRLDEIERLLARLNPAAG